MTATEFTLWVLLGLSVLGLIVLQLRNVAVARRLGGPSANVAIAIRLAVVAALVGLVVVVAWSQAAR